MTAEEAVAFQAVKRSDYDRIAALVGRSSMNVNDFIDTNGNSLLHWAVIMNDRAMVVLLIELGADVNKADRSGRTALHQLTASANSIEIAKVLIDSGADVNVGDKEERTPLHEAVSSANTEITRLLLMHGARPNIKDSAGNTALHYAAYGDRLEDAKLLIQAGADVNSRGECFRTPARIAEIQSSKRVLDLLRSRGAVSYGLLPVSLIRWADNLFFLH